MHAANSPGLFGATSSCRENPGFHLPVEVNGKTCALNFRARPVPVHPA
jgi:hypothetical protein